MTNITSVRFEGKRAGSGKQFMPNSDDTTLKGKIRPWNPLSFAYHFPKNLGSALMTKVSLKTGLAGCISLRRII